MEFSEFSDGPTNIARALPRSDEADDVYESPQQSHRPMSQRSHYSGRQPTHVQASLRDARSFASTQPRAWVNDLSLMPRRFFRRIFGLNPFKTSYWSLYRPLRDWRSRGILCAGIICAIAAGIPLPIIGVIFSSIIDSFPPPEAQLLTSIEELIGIAIAYFLVTWAWTICWGVTGEKVSRGLREALVEKLVGMDMTFFDTEDPDITTMLTGDTQMIQMGTSEKVGLFIQSISYFVAAFVVGFILNATLTGVLLAAVIPTMIIVVISGTTAVSRFSKRASDLTQKATEIASSAIGSVQVVQAFGANLALSDNHYRVISQAARLGFKKSLSGAAMLGLVYFTAYAANALAFYEGSRLATGGAGTIYAVVFLILDASFVVGQFGPFVQTFAQAASAGGKILELLDRPTPPVSSYTQEGMFCDDDRVNQDITFNNVSFWYPARPTTRVLDRINLKFSSHQMTGIVGMSGSGKSTIASLLLRLYDPVSGKISFGETSIDKFNVSSLRSQIALVDQDPVLFSGTILENIRQGLPDAQHMTEEEILSRCSGAASDANADFVSTLNAGIHTKVGGAGGTSLSGGQRQRLCLARALVRRPAILVLDEPTSALDTTSEALILKALKKVSDSGCTVIMIAHRLATIKDADNIIVMGHGRLLEQGSHQELLERSGPYKALVEAQGLEQTSDDDSPIPSSVPSSESLESGPQLAKAEKHVSAEETQKPAKDTVSRGTLYILRRCFALSRPELPFIILGLFASTVSGSIIIGEAIIFGHLVNLINTETSNPDLLRSQVDFFCLMFFVVSLVALFAYSVSGSAFGFVSESLVRRVRDISLRNILRQDASWFAMHGHSPHELVASMSMDVGHLSGLSGVIIGTVISVCVSIFGGIVLAHIVAWKIAVVLLSAVPVMVVAGYFRLRVLAQFEQRHETAYNSAAALATEACQFVRTVAAYGREHDVLRQYREAVSVPYRQSFKFNVLGNLMLAASLAITYFVYALAYYWGSVQVRSGKYTEQDFFIVLPALLFSAQAAGQMFSLAPEMTRAVSAANSVFKLHDATPSIMNTESIDAKTQKLGRATERHGTTESTDIERAKYELQQLHAPGSGQSRSVESRTASERSADDHLGRRGHVEFSSIGLTYASRPKDPALRDVNLTIEPGQFVALVGPSGAGKSTLVSLLERFYDPTSGAVMVDGTNIRDLPVTDYRQRLSLVSQDPDLFSGTIAFNIGLGARPGQQVNLEDIEQICQECGVHEFIVSLPEGYQTECGTNGSKLSGGQKQRIAIARALIRDPDILLLDEATASLDSHSEKQVQKATLVARRNRTTIVVAHRLSSVQKADKIFVFERGRLAEEGAHDELVAKGGVYAGMVRSQNLA